jgi:hypothetical protein
MQIPGLAQTSWLDDRVPEMLWAALLIAGLGRERALELFRIVAVEARKLAAREVHGDATLSGFAELPDDAREQVLHVFQERTSAQRALRPLLLFDALPSRDTWVRALACDPLPEDWSLLADAVLSVLDHQSQEATDCRWARVMFTLLGGRLHIPAEMGEEFLRYPDVDLRKVRPSVRALEGSFALMPDEAKSPWPVQFWAQCYRDTRCAPLSIAPPARAPLAGTSTNQAAVVRSELVAHSVATRSSTTVDARHEAVFGIAAYVLSVLDDLLRISNSTSVLGRTGLRSILEAYLTLKYLVHKDEPELWLAYRNYGSGQAKLAFLKLDELEGEAPISINVQTLERLANEDRWMEFVPINVGHWEKSNLRQMSEAAGVKGEYDRFYDWTSAFVHANWAAVRNAEYDVCANPLHRLHRILRSETRAQEDVVPDACRLTDLLLSVVEQAYPGFSVRVSLPPSV